MKKTRAAAKEIKYEQKQIALQNIKTSQEIKAIRKQKNKLQEKLEEVESDLLDMTEKVNGAIQTGNQFGHKVHGLTSERKEDEAMARVKGNLAFKQHLAKKLDAEVQKMEEQYEKDAHFYQNKYVYDIVDSALKGNDQNKAAVVSYLVQLHQRRQKTAETEVSTILMKYRTKKIEEQSQIIKVQYDGLVKFSAPKDYEICIEQQQKGRTVFLKHIVANYPSFINNELPDSLEPTALTSGEVKKTIIKLTKHYHPDKINTLPKGTWDEDDINLRNQITKILTDFKTKC